VSNRRPGLKFVSGWPAKLPVAFGEAWYGWHIRAIRRHSSGLTRHVFDALLETVLGGWAQGLPWVCRSIKGSRARCMVWVSQDQAAAGSAFSLPIPGVRHMKAKGRMASHILYDRDDMVTRQEIRLWWGRHGNLKGSVHH
jgi:hypothetical protein